MATIKQLREKQDRLAVSINQHKKAEEVATKQQKEAEKKLTDTLALVDSASKKLDLFQGKIAKLEEEVKRKSVNFSNEEQEAKDLIASISDKKAELAEVEEKIKKLNNDFSDAENKLKIKHDIFLSNMKDNIEALEFAEKELAEDNKKISADTKQLEISNVELEKNIIALNAKQIKAIEDLEKTKDNVENEKSSVAKLEEKVKEINKDIKTLEANKKEAEKEIDKTDKKREKAIADYKKEEKRLFRITEREEHIKSQEDFIRDMFERAGIPYEEFSEGTENG